MTQLNGAHTSKKSQLISQYESALIDKRSGGYNEALANSAREVAKFKDIIYHGGYKPGLTCVGIPPNQKLLGWLALCPPNLYTAEVFLNSKEKGDEASPSSPPPKAMSSLSRKTNNFAVQTLQNCLMMFEKIHFSCHWYCIAFKVQVFVSVYNR